MPPQDFVTAYLATDQSYNNIPSHPSAFLQPYALRIANTKGSLIIYHVVINMIFHAQVAESVFEAFLIDALIKFNGVQADRRHCQPNPYLMHYQSGACF